MSYFFPPPPGSSILASLFQKPVTYTHPYTTPPPHTHYVLYKCKCHFVCISLWLVWGWSSLCFRSIYYFTIEWLVKYMSQSDASKIINIFWSTNRGTYCVGWVLILCQILIVYSLYRHIVCQFRELPSVLANHPWGL